MKNEKGITLIALIITIIVMLILVGVTINVALNGGLFSKAKQGSFQTEASMVKEQFEIAKAIAIADNGGKPLDDYSKKITIDSTDLDNKTKDKYRGKIIINSNGDVCYDSTKITNKQEQDWLEAIGIKENTKLVEKEAYTITLAQIASKNIPGNEEGFVVPVENFWDESVSEELRNYTVTVENHPTGDFNGMVYYDFVCNQPGYTKWIDVAADNSAPPSAFTFLLEGDQITLILFNENGEEINVSNYAPYADFKFTITMP